jgi:hypothetical protein
MDNYDNMEIFLWIVLRLNILYDMVDGRMMRE